VKDRAYFYELLGKIASTISYNSVTSLSTEVVACCDGMQLRAVMYD